MLIASNHAEIDHVKQHLDKCLALKTLWSFITS